MKKVSIVSLIALIAIVISSCGSSNNVVNNRGISKRKYNKGFFFKRNSNVKTADSQVKEADFKEDKAIAKVEKVEARKAKKASKETLAESNVTSYDVYSTTTNLIITPKVEEEPAPEIRAFLSDDLNDIDWSVTENSSSATGETIDAMPYENKDQSSKKKSSNSSQARTGIVFVLAVVFAILLPPLGVGIYTNIDWTKVLIAFLLTLLAVVPGIVYALLVVFDVI
ncbi:MAG: YqaE/Pmp3 family membrane protein [Crocinitomicaceae bacterium]|nr:YqaE/Pmp3 family membrane protein [Crocinitomicaceae bacterium]